MTRWLAGLTGRMALGILLVHIILLPLLLGGVLYVVQANHQARFIAHSRAQTDLLIILLRDNINAGQVRELLVNDCDNGTLRHAEIRDIQGRRLFACGDAPDTGAPRADTAFGEGADDDFHISAAILDQSDTRLGDLHLAYPETDTRQRIESTYRRGMLLGSAYVIVTILLVVLFSRHITRPIRHLQRLSRRIAHGHYDEPLTVDTGISELRDLGQHLENMRRELVSRHDSIEQRALHDSLTQLPNRTLLHNRMEQAFASCVESSQALALLLLNLDRLKEINDRHGHLTGDLVLKETAERMRRCIRASDTVARLGGDEFAILLPSAERSAAERIAGEVVHHIADTYHVNDHQLQLGASLGIAYFPEHGQDFESLLRCADSAMYAAKRKGGGFVTYHIDLDRQMRRQVLLTEELRDAIDGGHLRMHFQAKMNLASNRVCCVEALVRWQHPLRGLIQPNDFIPLAERSGLIDPMTRWILRDCLRQTAVWLSGGLQLAVAVNLSAHSLHDENLPEYIEHLLKEYAVPAHQLELELTESALFSDPARALAILQRIHAMGVRLSIDDFGTGYSSLQQLRKLPVTQIKIDRGFVMGMARDDNDLAIVRATVHLAHDLNVAVVAEGVEDKQTLQMLRELGCDMIQGYHLSRPLPVDQFDRWISGQKHTTRHGT